MSGNDFKSNLIRLVRRFIADLPVVDIVNDGFQTISSLGRIMNNPVWELSTKPELWYMGQKKLEELRFKAIKYAFNYHYDNCNFYRRYCSDYGNVKPEDIHTIDDVLEKIPQIPTEAFKKTMISSIPKERIKTVVTTSGTSGNFSYLPRDYSSLLRLGCLCVNFMINIGAPRVLKEQPRFEGKMSKLLNYVFKNVYFSIFLPHPKEASTWFSSGFYGFIPFLKMFSVPYDFHLSGFRFDPQKILRTIKERAKDNKMVWNIGFHYVFNELMNYMDEEGETFELDPDGSNVCPTILAGGWKKLSGEAIDKEEFRKKIIDHFGVYDTFIADLYGFGESNTLAVDYCTERNMHLFPHVLAVTRDPDTLEIQDYGEEGLMSVWDPTVSAFPSFVISDDIVRLTEPFECDCGVISQCVEYRGRAKKAELRSCGLKMQQVLTDEEMRNLTILKEKALKTGIGL